MADEAEVLEGQIFLFDKDEGRPWKDEWKEMPEFVQDDLTPHQSVIVHFSSKEDAKRFADLVEQKITPKTQSLWYPAAEIGRYSNKRFSDEP